MYPVLLRIGSLALSSYTVLIDLGLLGGAAITCLEARRRGFSTARLWDAMLTTALGGIIVARLVYVATHWAYYHNHVRHALRPWNGGLAWHGALIGGLLALTALCAVRRIPLGLMLDLLTPGAAVLTIFVWLGCWLDRCAYGVESYPGQGVLWTLSFELPDLYGIWAPRVAVQLLGAAWGTAVLAALLVAARYVTLESLLFPLWLALYPAGEFLLGFVRADEAPLVVGWRIDQIANLALTLIGACVLTAGLLRNKRAKEDVA